MAAEAKRAALSAETPQMRKEYEELVQAWEQLIKEMEAAGYGSSDSDRSISESGDGPSR